MTDERVYLTYILDSISNIQDLAAQGRTALEAAKHDRAAVLYYLHTLAEATQRLSETMKACYPHIPWIAIGGFRNRLVHGYLDVNWNVIWDVIDHNLQPLKEAMSTALESNNPSSADPSE
ncbi:MAG: DUF86 domain-containing protein [Anaerolineae bacterium]|nr:DUF86 domain-containing protein [Anaerolineae bacterium]